MKESPLSSRTPVHVEHGPPASLEEEHLTGAGISSDSPDQTHWADTAQGYNARQTSVAGTLGDRLDPAGHPQAGAARAAGVHGARRAGLSSMIWLVLGIMILLVLAVVAWGILSRHNAEQHLEHTATEAAIPTVTVVYPSTAQSTGDLSLPGATQAFVDTPIYSRTNGYLKQWFFDIGAHVKKGQLMATIETPEVDQQLQVAQADLKASQASLNLANITSARYQNLLKSNSVSKQETDEAIGNAESKEANVEASEASVRRLQQLQSFEKVYAPFDGIVTARNTDVGDLIVAGQEGSGNGQNARELFHLASTSRLRVFVSVPEADVNDITDGEHATLTTDAYPGRVFDGVVARNANAVDPTTRTLNVEVDVPNENGALLPGAYVFVHFKLPVHGRYLTIPSNTLIFRSAGLQVGIVQHVRGEDRVRLAPVTIAHDDGATVQISAGLDPNDAVIANPSDSIASGQEVHVSDARQGSNL